MDTTSNPSEGSADLHPVLSLLSAFFWVVRAYTLGFVHYPYLTEICPVWLLSWVKFAVAFVTITIPRLVYATLSYSLTLTVRKTYHSFFIQSTDTELYRLAQLLVLRNSACCWRNRTQLLDPSPVLECVRSSQGTTSQEGECARATPRR